MMGGEVRPGEGFGWLVSGMIYRALNEEVRDGLGEGVSVLGRVWAGAEEMVQGVHGLGVGDLHAVGAEGFVEGGDLLGIVWRVACVCGKGRGHGPDG